MKLYVYIRVKNSSKDYICAIFEEEVIKCKHMFSDRSMSLSCQKYWRPDTRNWGQRLAAPRPVLLS